MDKNCSRCQQLKNKTEFHKDNSRKDGLSHRCKDCVRKFYGYNRYERYQKKYIENNYEKVTKRKRDYYHTNKDWLLPKMNASRFLKKYGITQEEAATLLEDQGGVCSICQTDTPTETGWCVDHNHDTGKIRGILCSKCNSGIGMLDDNPEFTNRATKYLEGR